MIEKRMCKSCGGEIPKERLEILPDTQVCVRCSETKPYSEQQLKLDILNETLKSEETKTA